MGSGQRRSAWASNYRTEIQEREDGRKRKKECLSQVAKGPQGPEERGPAYGQRMAEMAKRNRIEAFYSMRGMISWRR